MSDNEFKEKLLNVKQELIEEIDFFIELIEKDRAKVMEHLLKYGDLRKRDNNGQPLSKEIVPLFIYYQPTVHDLLCSVRTIDKICGIKNKRPRKFEIDDKYS
jgi:hypothetical protein